MNVSQATDLVNLWLAIGICLACLAIAGNMSRTTRCAVRLGVFGLFGGGLLVAGGGIWHFGEWVQTVFLGGALVYLLANLRSPAAIPIDRWSSALAWLVTFAVIVILGLSFAAGA